MRELSDESTSTRARWFVAFAASLLLGVALFVVPPAPAPAQAQTTTTTTCEPGPPDPYTGERTPCQEQRVLSVTLSIDAGPVGAKFQIHVCGLVPGAKVDVTFGGIVLLSTVADAAGCIDGTLTVPDVAAGIYDVCVISPGSVTTCVPFRVLGSGVQPTRLRFGSGIARTGLYVLPLVLVGLGAILTGRVLRSSGRRRRRA